MNAKPVRKMILTLAAAVALLAAATAVGAQQLPPSGGRLVLGAAQAPAAGTVPVSGAGCAPRAAVGLSVAGQPSGSAAADARGAFTLAVTIPAVAVGTVTVTATCTGPRGETHIMTGSVLVTDSAAGLRPLPPSHSSPPGIPTSAVLAFFAVCGVGGLAFAARRRRPRRRRVPVPAPVPAPVAARARVAPRVRAPEPAPAPARAPVSVSAARSDAGQPAAAPRADVVELASQVANALERVTTVSERVIEHVEYSRAQLHATLAAERADRRATLDALHELTRTLGAGVNEPATDLSASRTRSSFRRDP